jgi:hypothetical protein
MANPPHLFGADGRLDKLVLNIRPWSDDVVDKIGSDPHLPYVEDFWLGILGPQQAARSRPRRGVSLNAPAMDFSADEITEPVASQPSCRRSLEVVRSTGGCADPIHLIGRASLIDQGGRQILSAYHLREEAA